MLIRYFDRIALLVLIGAGLPGLAQYCAALPVVHMPVSPPVERVERDSRFVQYTLPKGTAFQILLETPINTGINLLQDPIEGIIVNNLYLNEELMLPKNTRLNGIIAQLEPAIQGRNAILAVAFTEMLLKNGEKLPIAAHVRTEAKDHTWGGELTPGTKPILSRQSVSGIGEYNRVVYGGPRAMGQNIQFRAGEHWTVILDQPLTLVVEKSAP